MCRSTFYSFRQYRSGSGTHASTIVDKLKSITQIISSWIEIPDSVKGTVEKLHS